MNDASCCSPPSHPERTQVSVSSVQAKTKSCSKKASTKNMARVPSGSFRMGAEGPECWASDGEGPIREFELDEYWIDRCCVTNSEFETFVEETGYLTRLKHSVGPSFSWGKSPRPSAKPSGSRQWSECIGGRRSKRRTGANREVRARASENLETIRWFRQLE